jgi:transposase-like protein
MKADLKVVMKPWLANGWQKNGIRDGAQRYRCATCGETTTNDGEIATRHC